LYGNVKQTLEVPETSRESDNILDDGIVKNPTKNGIAGLAPLPYIYLRATINDLCLMDSYNFYIFNSVHH